MRFVHAADLHVDSPLRGLEEYEGAPAERVRHATREALKNLVQLCLEEQAAFLLIAGDLFDNDWRDFNTPLFVVHQLRRLEKEQIPVYLILGNHDSHAGMSRKVPWPGNVTLFDHRLPESVELPKWNVALHGMSFPKREVLDNLVPLYPAPRKGLLNIGLLHTNANASKEHGSYAPCTVAELAAKRYDYWALGHVHTHEVLHEEPFIVYSGNTQGRHIRESGMKGCVVVSTDGQGITKIETRTTDVLRWYPLELTLSPADSLDDLYDRCRHLLSDVAQRAGGRLAAVRLDVKGRCAAHRDLNRPASRQEAIAHLRSLAGACSEDLWLEKISFRTQPALDREALKQAPDLVGDLLRSIDALQAPDSDLAALKNLLKPLRERAANDLGAEDVDLEDDRQIRNWLCQAEGILLNELIAPDAWENEKERLTAG